MRLVGVVSVLALLFLSACSELSPDLAGELHSAANGDTLVTVGSPPTPFAQNKQNEPWLAVDPSNPLVMVAGANDNIDLEACAAGDPTTCPFTNGVGVTGVSFSLDGGQSWTQPVYTGYSARECLGPDPCEPNTRGPIGTLPWYFEEGLVSDGDPALVFGPRPGEDGSFSWANGSRLYFTTLTSNFFAERDMETIKGFEAIAISRTDDVAAAAAGDKSAWMRPVIVSKQNEALFSDKEAVWADNAASSPYFGNVYVCNVGFRGSGGAEPVFFARSNDGGDTWKTRQISQAANSVSGGQGRSGGRQGCLIRSDSSGTVYVIWRGSFSGENVIYLARSFDGGVRFERPRAVARTGSVGAFDPAQGRLTFDGVAGSRTNTSVWIDIANGAPTGAGAPDTVVMSWTDGRQGLDNERMLLQLSSDGGDTWSAEYDATEPGDRPDFPAIAISPDGQDLYAVYMGFLDPWRSDTSSPRRMQGVIRHAEASDPSSWATLHRGALGDARGSSANGLTTEFLGDYNYIVATNDFAAAVWNDVRDAAVCEAINAFRAGLIGIGPAAPRPAPGSDCPATFGNTDIFGGVYADPTP